jgi:hypothetical protein
MKKLKPYMGIGLMVLAAYLMYMLVPPYFNNYQFDDWIASETRLGTYGGKSADAIRDDVIKKAREYDIDLTAEQVRVEQDGRNTRISATYTVHVPLPLYPVDLHFAPGAETKGIKGL